MRHHKTALKVVLVFMIVVLFLSVATYLITKYMWVYFYDLPSITDRDRICDAFEAKEKNINDSQNPLVTESKRAILSIGISSDYFNKHFQLICAGNGRPSEVRWHFTIGDFSKIIYDVFYKDRNIHSVVDYLYGLKEINKVISKVEAGKRMQSCIGDFHDAGLGFAPIKGQKDNTGIYLSARSSIKFQKNSWPITDLGKVDLQTGECIKSTETMRP